MLKLPRSEVPPKKSSKSRTLSPVLRQTRLTIYRKSLMEAVNRSQELT